MGALLAAQLMLEVFHRVGDEGLVAGNAGLGQRLVQHLPGRPDEGVARQVLLVAGLFAHQHQLGPAWPLARHPLRPAAVEFAASAHLQADMYLLQRGHRQTVIRGVAAGTLGGADQPLGRGGVGLAGHGRAGGLWAGDRLGNGLGHGQVPPELLQARLARRVGRIGARREAERAAVPMGADVRGQERKPPPGEALGEEPGHGLGHPMGRLEPGDPHLLAVGAGDRLEVGESPHLLLGLGDTLRRTARHLLAEQR